LVIQRFIQKRLAKEIDSLSYDLVFVTHDRSLASPWVLRYLKTKTVFLCQEPTRAYFEKFLDIDPGLSFLQRLYEKVNRYFRKNIETENIIHATKVIANSCYSVESIFRAYGVVSAPIYLGIDTDQFFPMKTKKLNQVIIVGNDEPQKALRFAVRSLSLIPKNIRPSLVIASPRTALDKSFLVFAKSLKVEIKNLYGLKPDELCREYNHSVVTIATAFLEPFGLSVIESMACGTPVLAVKEAGFRETIENGVTGILVETMRFSFPKTQN
jgi:glycosyltransferase involved in cell wall biosynthesis